MPFVVAERGPNSPSKDEIECLCKEAWVAMNEDGGNALKATDVGGIAITRQIVSPKVMVRFFYCNRGEEFKQKLYGQLRNRFGELVQPIPVEAEGWFADPIWAIIKEEEKDKCVLCDKETPYLRNAHIDIRMYYVEGCGQLCKECYDHTD